MLFQYVNTDVPRKSRLAKMDCILINMFVGSRSVTRKFQFRKMTKKEVDMGKGNGTTKSSVQEDALMH